MIELPVIALQKWGPPMTTLHANITTNTATTASMHLKTLLLAGLLACFGLAGSALATTPVGEVSLVIGAARVIGETGNSAAVQRGLPVYPGDRIETEDGGHVHLRFVDGAFVSVRPGSRLLVENYRYDPQQPQNSAIRFRLDQGVVRSITGKGGEAAREQFRLNTPIAAIGVKGTDFVVQALGDDVRVAVHSGAIVLAPLGEGCASDAFGPCQTDAARILSADMGRVMLEFNRQQGTPRVVSINGQTTPDRAAPPADEPRTSSLRHNDASAETLAARTVDAGRDMLPVQPPPPPLPPATLVWGHWQAGGAFPGDATTDYAGGRQNGERHMISGNQYYMLFRPADQSGGTLPRNLGQADFVLRDAQVHFVPNEGAAASLGGSRNGWLKVDFGTRRFDTGMTLTHPTTAATQLTAAGTIDRTGQFQYNNKTDTRLSGGLTLDGQEAGYTFVRDIATGKFVGITRWVR